MNMLSIITTAYNVEKYLRKCIDSVLSQTFTDFEFIIVNDCSTDETLKIVETYNDKRIKVINNKENVGAGLSRRYGIQESKGEYVLLLDGDDYLSQNYIEELYNAAKEHDADIASGGVTFVEEDTYKEIGTTFKDVGVFYGEEQFLNETKNTRVCFLNNKLIKRSLYNLVEYCDRRYIEDTPTLMKLLYYSKKSVYINNLGYFYTRRKGSLTYDKKKEKETIFSMLFFIDLYEFFKDKEDCYGKRIYTFDQILLELKVMEMNGLKPEDMRPWTKEWNYIVNYINNELDKLKKLRYE